MPQSPGAREATCTPTGYVAEHDLARLTRKVEHRFSSETFSGRLVHPVCLKDTVQVCSARGVFDGRYQQEFVLEFDKEDPSQFNPSIYGEESFGAVCAYDVRHDAVFYGAEFDLRLYRKDLATGELRNMAASIYGEDVDPDQFGSHLVHAGDFHDERDTVFYVQWLAGSKIFEIDRTTFELRQEYSAHNGGNHASVVDAPMNRIYAAGVWGIDVLDIPSGEVVFRHRLGLGCRMPVVDEVHDLVFVPTTIGRLWVLDRRGPSVLGFMTLLGGGRNAFLTSTGKLLASSEQAYYAWDTAALNRFFRRGRTPQAPGPFHPAPIPQEVQP